MLDYNKIKHSVPLIEAAQRYGSVKHGFMRCPFHADRTPSLKRSPRPRGGWKRTSATAGSSRRTDWRHVSVS